MIHDIVIQEESIDDIRQGNAFYSSKDASLGQYFIECIYSDIESLLKQGGIHQKHFGFHRKLSKVFPYAIYYLVSDQIVYVSAILPMKRSPKWIRASLTKRH